MKLIAGDGGGGGIIPPVPKPAPKADPTSDALDPKKGKPTSKDAKSSSESVTTPAKADDAPKHAASKKVALKGSHTSFSHSPFIDGGDSIRDFISAAKHSKSAPVKIDDNLNSGSSKPKHKGKPPIDHTKQREAKANKSRYSLRNGQHKGDLTKQIDGVQKQIDDLEGKKSRGEGMGTVAKVATNIVMPLAGLFGLDDKVKSGVEHLAGVDDAIKDLKKEKTKLEEQVTLNGMSQMLYSQGAPLEVVNVLQDTKKVTVVPDKEIEGADAAYSMEDDKMLVSQGVVDDAKPIISQMQAAGAMDAEGYIIDSRKAEELTPGNDLLKLALLPSAHEETHAEQAKTAMPAITDIAAKITNIAADKAAAAAPTVAEADEIRTRAAVKNELRRVIQHEVPAYHNQEMAHINLGAIQHNVMTVDEDGNTLPIEESALNVYWSQEDLKFNAPLTPQLQKKAGETPATGGAAVKAYGQDDPGRRLFPGTATDPGRRLFPGNETDPGRRLFPGDELDPGRRLFPGQELDPGRRLFPGQELDPGRRLFPGKELEEKSATSDAKNGASSVTTPPPAIATAPVPQKLTAPDAGTSTVTDTQLDEMVDKVLAAYEEAGVAVDAPGVFESGPMSNDDPGRRLFPGNETAPGRRLFPGNETAPGRRLFPGSELDPGRRLFPGQELDPGRRLFPGQELDPGRRLFPGKVITNP